MKTTEKTINIEYLGASYFEVFDEDNCNGKISDNEGNSVIGYIDDNGGWFNFNSHTLKTEETNDALMDNIREVFGDNATIFYSQNYEGKDGYNIYIELTIEELTSNSKVKFVNSKPNDWIG
jgi:hypothetical protein